MLQRGPRVFHVNGEQDVVKLENWLRRGPKYQSAKLHAKTSRRIGLYGDLFGDGETEQVGVIVVMSKSFAADKVMEIALKWRAD